MFNNINFVLLCRYVYIKQLYKLNYYVIRKNWNQCRVNLVGSSRR